MTLLAQALQQHGGDLLLPLVDLVLLVSLAELLWLLLRRPLAWAGLVPNVLAGLCLVLALRLGLQGAGVAWVAPCLLAAGLCHALDLRDRLRPPAAAVRPLQPID